MQRDKFGRFIKGHTTWNKKSKPKKICLICKKIFYVRPYEKNTAKYCSKKCFNVSKIGKRQINSGFKKGFTPWNKGKKGLMPIPWNKNKKGVMPTPWNKGTKGICKPNTTSFKIGQFSLKKHPMWKGGKFTTPSGYIMILKPNHPFCNKNGYIFEHRFIIEKYLRRYLKPKEITHHINGIRDDNRIKNLIAFNSISAHKRFHKNSNNIKTEEIIFNGKNIHYRASK